jgi:hypothetical protein
MDILPMDFSQLDFHLDNCRLHRQLPIQGRSNSHSLTVLDDHRSLLLSRSSITIVFQDVKVDLGPTIQQRLPVHGLVTYP